MGTRIKMNLEQVAATLNEGVEAKRLLDKIISYWDPYSGEINVPEWDKSFDRNSLLMDIRNYIQFDDSE